MKSSDELSASQRTLSVNVDIDAIRFYYGIHGLSSSSILLPDPVWNLGVPRFLDLFEELKITATFFIVASDLLSTAEGGAATDHVEIEKRRGLVQKMVAQGHE